MTDNNQPRDGVIDRNHFDFTRTDTDLVAGIHYLKVNRRLFPGRQFREIGPDDPVEDMILDRFNRRFLGVHHDRLVVHAEHAIGEQRQADDVIHMRMRQKYMTNTGHLIERQIAQSGTRVNQQIVIDQKGGRPQIRPDTARPSEYLNLHVLN